MRLQYLFLMFFMLGPGAFGQGQDLRVGAMIGANLTDLRNRDYGSPTETSPGAGWSGAAIVWYDLAARFRTTAQIGGLVERTKSTSQLWPSTYSKRDITYSWAEGTFQVAYLPIAREKFELQAGTGITVRRIIKASIYQQVNHVNGTGGIALVHDITDKVVNWTCVLPLSLAAVFDRGSSGTVVIGTEFQYGLRDLYDSQYSFPNVAFDYGFVPSSVRLYSISLKVAFMMPVGN